MTNPDTENLAHDETEVDETEVDETEVDEVEADDAEAAEAETPELPESVAEQVAVESAEQARRRAEDLRVVEALLFATNEPLSERTIKERLGDGSDVPALMEELRALYKGRGIEVLQGNGRWSFRTAPDITDRLRLEKLVPRKLSRAAIETLAIIGYHQPVTRAEIEEIRGVAVSSGTVDILLEEGWIKPRGRKEVPGRPVMWGTSNAFLDHFGLESIQDLPGIEELRASGLLDSRRGVSAYGTRGGETTLFDTDESDETAEPLNEGGEDKDADEGED
jgi:segregation and condensation protein B